MKAINPLVVAVLRVQRRDLMGIGGGVDRRIAGGLENLLEESDVVGVVVDEEDLRAEDLGGAYHGPGY